MNVFGFADGDPINFSDPFGLWPCCSVIGMPHSELYTEVQRDWEKAQLDFIVDLVSGGLGGTERSGAQVVGKSLSRIGTKMENLFTHLTPQDLRGASRDIKGVYSG